MPLSHSQVQQFKINGYLILPNILSQPQLDELIQLSNQHLVGRIEPLELETDVHYPGAPASESAKGGNTIRRLLHVYDRTKLFKQWATNTFICNAITQILDSKKLILNRNHHNCVMTKLPEYSSETLWHRDTRYWNFNNKYLVNAWFALGDEKKENGGMKILPGSHRWDIEENALDEQQFLKLDHPANQEHLATQREVNLNKGDVLLFSAHCFHAAGKNTTDKAKLSMVFTYHGEGTEPLPDTKSNELNEINVSLLTD